MSLAFDRPCQRGFIQGTLLIGLALMIVILGAFARANRGASTRLEPETAQVMAQTLIKRGNEIKDVVATLSQDRDIRNLVLASSAVAPLFGLYDPAITAYSEVRVPGKAFTTGVDQSFVLDKTSIKVSSIGTAGTEAIAIAIVVPDVTDMTCRMVNALVSGDPIDATIPAIVSGVAVARLEGCAIISSRNTYYRVIGSMS